MTRKGNTAMTADSTNTPTDPITIFTTPEADFGEVLAALPPEAVRKLADQQVSTLCAIHMHVVGLLNIPSLQREAHDLALSMMECMESDVAKTHDVIFAGAARDKLMQMFPGLNGKGDVA